MKPESIPQPGPEVDRLLEVLRLDHGLTDPSARLQKLAEAQRILSQGPMAAGGRSSVGLALGFVQSGKTMAFTMLAALAADTGYRMLVTLLGNTHLLVEQNTERLLSDLRIEQRDDFRWVSLALPDRVDLDPFLEQDDRVLLITVLKNPNRLNKLARLLENSKEAGRTPALIIDDEADQASLNAAASRNRQTSTYRAINRVRAALGPHLYMQYTATPFAPLLLEPRDHLSPEFLELLEPGQGYTGGNTFFLSNRDAIVREIPDVEADDRDPTRLPEGLAQSLVTFLTSAALLRADGRMPLPVSMLVHTSGMKADHSTIYKLLESQMQMWRTKARYPAGDPAREAWLKPFIAAMENFAAHGTPALGDDELAQHLEYVARMSKIWVVNSSDEAESLDWKQFPVNILIGGNKLNRGFTVRGLTTTYMTRNARAGQADTIEQRARCYGYKASYINECRFFGPGNVIDAFTSLVHTEADMRESLLAWNEAGLPINRWSATEGLLLPGDMRPTRPGVLKETYTRTATGWSFLRLPDLDAHARVTNFDLVESSGILSRAPTRFGDVLVRITDSVPTLDIVDLIERWTVSGSPGWSRHELVRALRSMAESALLETMSLIHFEVASGEGSRPRVREWHEPDGFVQLMQGENKGTGYPGDRYLREGLPQLQVHRLSRRGHTEDLLGLALYLPPLKGGVGKVVRA